MPKGIPHPEPCEVDGCSQPHYCRGYCAKHHMRWRRHGDPTTLLTCERRELWSLVDKDGPGGCWLWTGSQDGKGYGKTGRGRIHRIVYEELVGPIPDGLQLDHLCRVRNCVNPAHLEPVTGRENVRRGRRWSSSTSAH